MRVKKCCLYKLNLHFFLPLTGGHRCTRSLYINNVAIDFFHSIMLIMDRDTWKKNPKKHFYLNIFVCFKFCFKLLLHEFKVKLRNEMYKLSFWIPVTEKVVWKHTCMIWKTSLIWVSWKRVINKQTLACMEIRLIYNI